MRFRLELLAQHKLKLADIQRVISGMEPLPGAIDFANAVKERTQLIILSDTFEQFAKPLMAKLSWPTMFCNSLVIGQDGSVSDYKLRQPNGKREAVLAFKSLNTAVFAAGDSFNDLAMIHEADAGCLFRAPETIRKENPAIPCVDTFDALLAQIDSFLN
jgi:phosphoserine/homoserine phosphotransferase